MNQKKGGKKGGKGGKCAIGRVMLVAVVAAGLTGLCGCKTGGPVDRYLSSVLVAKTAENLSKTNTASVIVTPPVTPPVVVPVINRGSTSAPCNEPDENVMDGNYVGFKSFPDAAEAWRFVDRQNGRIQAAGHTPSCSGDNWRAWVKGCSSRGCSPSPAVAIFGPTSWVNSQI